MNDRLGPLTDEFRGRRVSVIGVSSDEGSRGRDGANRPVDTPDDRPALGIMKRIRSAGGLGQAGELCDQRGAVT